MQDFELHDSLGEFIARRLPSMITPPSAQALTQVVFATYERIPGIDDLLRTTRNGNLHVLVSTMNLGLAPAIMRELVTEARHVFFIYIGKTHPWTSMQLVQEMRARYPEAMIIALACLCVTDDARIEKAMKMNKMFADHVVTVECRGETAMRMLLDEVTTT